MNKYFHYVCKYSYKCNLGSIGNFYSKYVPKYGPDDVQSTFKSKVCWHKIKNQK